MPRRIHRILPQKTVVPKDDIFTLTPVMMAMMMTTTVILMMQNGDYFMPDFMYGTFSRSDVFFCSFSSFVLDICQCFALIAYSCYTSTVYFVLFVTCMQL